MKTTVKFILFLLAAVALSGCAAQQAPRIFWPPPPGETFLEFIGAYNSAASFDKTGWEQFVEKIVGSDSGEPFSRPTGIVSNGRGVVYVADSLHRNVRIFDFNKRKMHLLTKSQVLARPTGLAMDSQQRLFVADGGAQKIAVFAADDTLLFSFGGPDLFVNPAYLAINERLGRIYVADGGAHKIVVFDLQGRHLFSFGEVGTMPGKFFSPQGMAIDRDNNVFIADVFNARVQVFDADGKYVRHFGTRGDGAGQMEMPVDLAFDSDGHLFLIDVRKSALTVFNSKDEPIFFLGGVKSSSPLAFVSPSFMHIDATDRIYITDMINLRFVVWQYTSPAYLQAHPISSSDLEKLEAAKLKKKESPEIPASAEGAK